MIGFALADSSASVKKQSQLKHLFGYWGKNTYRISGFQSYQSQQKSDPIKQVAFLCLGVPFPVKVIRLTY